MVSKIFSFYYLDRSEYLVHDLRDYCVAVGLEGLGAPL